MFGEIACVTLSVYFMKKIRTALKGNVEPIRQLPKVQPMPGPCSIQSLSGTSKAAVILMSLQPQITASLCNELGPETVQELTRAITRLPEITATVRQQVHQEFSGQAGLPSSGDAIKAVEQIGMQDPRLLASMLKQIYLQ